MSSKPVTAADYGLHSSTINAPFHKEFNAALEGLLAARKIHAHEPGDTPKLREQDELLLKIEQTAVSELIKEQSPQFRSEAATTHYNLAPMLTRVVARAARLTLRQSYLRFDTWFSIEKYASLTGESVPVAVDKNDAKLLPDHIPPLDKEKETINGVFGWEFYVGADRILVPHPLHAWLLPISEHKE